MSVWRAIDSTPRTDTILRPVSLGPVWPEGKQREKICQEVTSGQIIEEPLMLFNGKISLYIFLVHFERALSIVSNKK